MAARKTTSFSHKQNLLLIITGLLLVSFVVAWRLYQATILSFNPQVLSQPLASLSGSAPVKIDIDRLNLHLPVEPATVTDGTWEISLTAASWWNNSAPPGTPGNIVIYGHNKNNLFGPIRWLELGDTLVLTDAAGVAHRYAVIKTFTISPNDVQYILPTQQETLTLYTCTGFLDRQRYLVIAQPLSS